MLVIYQSINQSNLKLPKNNAFKPNKTLLITT